MAKDKDIRVIEVADFMFANPAISTANILAEFGTRWHISPRTCARLIQAAKEYNRVRIEMQESAKNEAMIEAATNYGEGAVVTKESMLRVLVEIALSKASTDRNRVAAVTVINKMQGYEVPQKVANTDSLGNDLERPLTAERKREILKEVEL